MFGFNPLTVIERCGVVGIIVGWEGRYARVMFEHRSHEVEFAYYPISALARFRVIG